MGQKKKGNKKANPKVHDGAANKTRGSGMVADTSRSSSANFDRKLRDEAEKEAQQAMQVAFIKLMNDTEPTYNTDDGDLSQVTGDAAIKLKWKWASGLDWNPSNMLLSSWMRVLAAGDYEAMLSEIEKTPADQVKNLLERRETMYNFSALFHVIKGASATLDESGTTYNDKCKFVDRTKQAKHLQCAVKLIELGANVNAKDMLGATPLFFCVMRYRNKVTLKIAKILLDNGADANALNRLGETALLQPAIMKRYDCVKFLYDHGTDQSTRDYEGGSVQDLTVMDKELKDVLSAAKQSVTADARRMCCILCGQQSKSRCTACFLVRYCSKECQLVHWDKHKKACKEMKKKLVLVKVDHSEEEKERIPKDDFIGKLQITEEKMITLEHQKHGLLGRIQSTEPCFQQIREKVDSTEVKLGYFQVVVDKDMNIRINLIDSFDNYE